jgi:hypothetical protein
MSLDRMHEATAAQRRERIVPGASTSRRTGLCTNHSELHHSRDVLHRNVGPSERWITAPQTLLQSNSFEKTPIHHGATPLTNVAGILL